MSKINIGPQPQQIIPKSKSGSFNLVNLDLVNTISVGKTSSIKPGGTNTDDIPPLGSASYSTDKQWWACSPVACQLQVMDSGTSWSPSPIQIAEQLALTGINVQIPGFFVYQPNGTTDGSKINNALGLYGTVILAPGTYGIDTPILLDQNGNCIIGSLGVILVPLVPMTALIIVSAINTYAGNMQWYGGTNTTANNPACDGINYAPGTLRHITENILPLYLNGAFTSCTPTGAMHVSVRNVHGTDCNSGITLLATSTKPAQWTIEDFDIQNLMGGPAMQFGLVTDVQVTKVNTSMNAANATQALIIGSGCQTMNFSGLDMSGNSNAAIAVLQISDTGSGSSEINFTDCVFQNGGIGVQIQNNASRLTFKGVMAKRSQGDGWQLSNSGAFNRMEACGGNINNQAAGVAYDVNVSSTGHWLNDGFAYVSGGVTFGRNLAVGNHYTEANPPSSMTNTGAGPGGW